MTKAEKEIINCDEAIKTNPNDPTGYYDRGSLKYDMEDYVGAKSDFSKAIALNPTKPEYYFGRGNSLRYLDDYPAAIRDYSAAIDIDPSFFEAYNLRGKTKMLLKNYEDAILDFNMAIEIEPKFEFAYSNRGLSKQALEDYEGAIEDFSKAIEIDPTNTEFCNYLDIVEEEYYAANGTSYEKEDDNYNYDSNSANSLKHGTSSNLEYKTNFEIALNVIYKHPDESIGLSFKIINFSGIDTGYLYWLEVWQLNQQTFGRWPLITNNYQNFLPEGIDIRNVNIWFPVVINGEPIPLLLSRTESFILGQWKQPVNPNFNKSLKF